MAPQILKCPLPKEIINGYLKYGSLDSVQHGLATNWKKVIGPDGRKINPIDNLEGWQALGWNNYYNLFTKISFPLSSAIKVRFSNLAEQRYRQFNSYNAWYDYNMPGQNIQILSSNKQTFN